MLVHVTCRDDTCTKVELDCANAVTGAAVA